MNTIEQEYINHCNVPPGHPGIDITEHMPTLRKYAEDCTHITEFGVRYFVSTWAFLAGTPKKLVSYDYLPPSHYGAKFTPEEIQEFAKEQNIDFSFILGNTLDIIIEETELLFIDTLHDYSQLRQELSLHGNKSTKYIILHDTVLFGNSGQSPNEYGLLPAMNEFLQENPQWKIKEHFENCNGLTVLSRI